MSRTLGPEMPGTVTRIDDCTLVTCLLCTPPRQFAIAPGVTKVLGPWHEPACVNWRERPTERNHGPSTSL